MNYPIFSPVGDSAISATFGDMIQPSINRQIRQVLHQLEEKNDAAIIEVVPTYCSLLVQYDSLVYTYKEMCELITEHIPHNAKDNNVDTVKVIELPTVYGGEYGPDIDFVASHAGLTVEEVIKKHSGIDYLAYMLGFIPGFAYLGGMDPALTTSRLSTPRTLIPAGSVGIAGSQTGTYPSDSPGGWQIIGRTPLVLYDGNRDNPALLSAGDYIRYAAISESDYKYIEQHREDYKVNSFVCKEDELHVYGES